MSMKYWNTSVMSAALGIGLLLGLVDSIFDYLYVYGAEEPYLTYLLTDWPAYEFFWRGSFLVVSLLAGVGCSYLLNTRLASERVFKDLFDAVIPVCITNNDHEIVLANKGYFEVFGHGGDGENRTKCFESRPGPRCKTEDCPLEKIAHGGRKTYACESTKVEADGSERTFIVTATPHHDGAGRQIGIVECFQDITERRKLEREKELLIADLKQSRSKVKTLSGFLPICARCKKIRDDKGFWSQVETYLGQHSDAEFSHSICPECAARHYGKLSKA